MSADDADRTQVRRVVRKALLRYLAGSLVVLVLVSLGAIWISGKLARDAALRDAERTARAITAHLVAPLADEALRNGDITSLTRLDQAVRPRITDGTIYRVKVWEDARPIGARVLYSDDARLRGLTFVMEPQEAALFGTTNTRTELSNLDRVENQFERPAGTLVEVYEGFTDSSGAPLLFEAYFPAQRVLEDTGENLRTILPVTIGALLLLELLTLPLAVLLARRVAAWDLERSRAVQRATEATDDERRRIAQHLHDGVVQDLAGVGLALDTVQQRLEDEGGHADVSSTVARAGGLVRGDLESLRSLITDVYPVEADGGHLVGAVEDLVASLDIGGTEVHVSAEEDLAVPDVTAVAAYRVIREALRNVAAHAHADHVDVSLSTVDDTLRVAVTDDGMGFDPDAEQSPGHFGVRLLHDTCRTAGGELSIVSSFAGTEVVALLPLHP